MDYVIRDTKAFLRVDVAIVITSAVAKVASAVATASGRPRRTIAAIYGASASAAADRIHDGISAIGSGRRPCAATNPGSSGAVLQAAQLRAPLVTLRDYTSIRGQQQAADALAAADTGDCFLPYATCTYSKDPGSCEAKLQAEQLQAALYALWSHNTRARHSEARDYTVMFQVFSSLPAIPS